VCVCVLNVLSCTRTLADKGGGVLYVCVCVCIGGMYCVCVCVCMCSCCT
jgi:hypothetical protein